jgi:hypothetical protein
MELPPKALFALIDIKKSLLSDEVAEKATEASTQGRRVEEPTPRTFCKLYLYRGRNPNILWQQEEFVYRRELAEANGHYRP